MTLQQAVSLRNLEGSARVLLVCEHASAEIPARFKDLGIAAAERYCHAVWDIGALDLSQRVAGLLDAPLIAAPVSRLVVDCNRALNASDLIVKQMENGPIPGNRDLAANDRNARIAGFHVPFHEAIDTALGSREDIGAVVSIHSFTPNLSGARRPWEIGILYEDADAMLADELMHYLAHLEGGVRVGRNQPYSPADGVYYTLNRHARPRGLRALMIEVRNDLLHDDAEIATWSRRIAAMLRHALAATGLPCNAPEG